MMIDPPIDKLIDKVGCKYQLVCVTAKRAKQVIQKHGEMLTETGQNPVTYAAKEIHNGTVIVQQDD